MEENDNPFNDDVQIIYRNEDGDYNIPYKPYYENPEEAGIVEFVGDILRTVANTTIGFFKGILTTIFT